ncbi:Dynamin family protein [Corynebacterium endometrii]|uniref:Dynamin family protein n=1 Tax=Corynebacterium endometrii TaxID=2488819 RepID=A0A4P7QDL9_9CORY|nr:Dynamin family protein [Corynebacterium endometrii]
MTALRDKLAAARFRPEDQTGADASAIVAQLDDYVLPRLANIDAPLLAVVGGSTGSGKSTLVNSTIGEKVTASGVIRPTTRQPSLVVNPADAEWFNSPHVLPDLPRTHGPEEPGAQADSLRIVETPRLSPGLALLDAPDFDSIDDKNRALASQLLAAADLWVFVTTPARYADNLVWDFLNDAAGRDIEVLVILNRVDEDAMATVPQDLRRMMDEAGLNESRLITVPFAKDFAEFLPDETVAPAREVLSRLAADSAARREMAGKTVLGAMERLVARVDALSEERARQEAFAAQLREAISANYDRASEHVIDATSDGNLLRQEVMARWQDFVGTSDAFRTIERWYSSALDKLGSWFSGKPAPMREVETEIESGLHAVVVDAAETAATRSWSHLGSVAPSLRADAAPELAHASTTINGSASELVREWQTGLMGYIQDNAADKRMKARVMSIGLNVVTVALMLVVFASTAGLSGGELAIAGGSAVVGQKLLETIFGEDAVRRMARHAREDLNARVHVLFEQEEARYNELIDSLASGTTSGEMRQAARLAAAAVREEAGVEAIEPAIIDGEVIDEVKEIESARPTMTASFMDRLNRLRGVPVIREEDRDV